MDREDRLPKVRLQTEISTASRYAMNRRNFLRLAVGAAAAVATGLPRNSPVACINLINPGSGYTTPPCVTFASPAYVDATYELSFILQRATAEVWHQRFRGEYARLANPRRYEIVDGAYTEIHL